MTDNAIYTCMISELAYYMVGGIHQEPVRGDILSVNVLCSSIPESCL
uniref:Uncharacterized protein n=1 Tax=Arundo donax TaxID=35708 RepID=A0A0A8ZJB4_ARUDO